MSLKILLDSYVAENFGDDLLVSIVCKRYPQHEFWLTCSNDYLDRLGSPSNLHALGPISSPQRPLHVRAGDKLRLLLGHPRRRFANLIKSGIFDMYLLLGGSLFIENDEPTQKGREAELRLAARSLRSSGLIDCNFGPYKTQGYRDRHEAIFCEMSFISFRDSQSYEIFRHIPGCTYGADLAFSLADVPCQQVPGVTATGPAHLAILPIDPGTREDLSESAITYFDALERLAREHLRELNTDVVLIACCEAEGDLRACAELRRRLSDVSDRVAILPDSTPSLVIDTIVSASMVIASRFHAIAVALAADLPVIALSYSAKIDNALQDLGIESNCTRISDLRLGADILPLERTENLVKNMATYMTQFAALERCISITERTRTSRTLASDSKE